MRDPELALLEREALTEVVQRDLSRLLGIRGQPTFQHHVVFRRAIPQYEVGYGRFKDAMADLERRAPGVFLAGHYRDGVSLGDSIVSGYNVAQRIRGFLGEQLLDGPRPSPHPEPAAP
jgi:protoporphyrinogen/coproporphyrinogen III oxidase